MVLKERSHRVRRRGFPRRPEFEAALRKRETEEASFRPVRIIRPTLPDLNDVLKTVRESYASGVVTSGKVVELFEDEVRRFTMAGHAVAVSSCTAGLILAFAAMDFPDGAEVVVPSFTFSATVQALLWNRLTPVYVDCHPRTMTIDPGEVKKAIGRRTVAICPVNVYGLPPEVDALEEISRTYGLPLIFDSAQGLGSTWEGRPSGGFGVCEVFSLSPTKVVTAIEGGVATTNDSDLAQKLRSMRDYGKGPGGEEMIFKGLSARMSEIHAAVGLLSLRNAHMLIRSRLKFITYYRERTANFPGCRVQEFPANRTTSGNYFTLFVGDGAKVNRDKVLESLEARKIQSKRYFYPPVHAQKIFRDQPHRIVGDLASTWAASLQSLALPLYSHMSDEELHRICDAVECELT